MRISDWSSDVCSSDLPDPLAKRGVGRGEAKLMGVVRAQGAKRLSLGPVHFASGNAGRVPRLFPRWQLPPLARRGPGPPMHWSEGGEGENRHARAASRGQEHKERGRAAWREREGKCG